MQSGTKKFFPIESLTSCRIKWAWSTIILSSGVTSSCHRASTSIIDPDNFANFHNTETKLLDRQKMIDGYWPGNGCEYCRDTEHIGGYSDRMFQLTVPDMHPTELDVDPGLTNVDPVVLEIFFENTCNLACIYCSSDYSSRIQTEDKKFGSPLTFYSRKEQVSNNDLYNKLIPKFWEWLDTGYGKLKRIHLLGGEPFLLDDFYKLIDYIDQHPNPDLELNIVTNLMVKHDIIAATVEKFKMMLAKRKLKRVEILASVDCWGAEQEYIRYGFDCDKFENNFQYLLDQKYIRLGILCTVTSLSIRSMPELAKKFILWNTQRDIDWYTHLVLPINKHLLSPEYFDITLYKDALNEVLAMINPLGDRHTQNNKVIAGIFDKLTSTAQTDVENQKNLLNYLNEVDRRRKLNWRNVFPWLEDEFKRCGTLR